jgi:hypothetical protein
LQDEVSSPTATPEETKTEEARNPLPQTTLRQVFRSKDFSDWMMNREYFLKYSQTYGPFDLGGASDVDDILDELKDANFYTHLDLAFGFWQVQVRDEYVHKTAFQTPDGLMEWVAMPFELFNAPPTF